MAADIRIHSLERFDPAWLEAIATGYTTDAVYQAAKQEGDAATTLSLRLEPLESPRTVRYTFNDDQIRSLVEAVKTGFSFGASEGERLVGFGVAEPHWWNHTLWVWDFHVAPAYRGRGVGRALMVALAAKACEAGLRALVCETQNINVPAIRFYRRVGFVLDGIDLSYYTNEDALPGREVAVFMKLKFG